MNFPLQAPRMRAAVRRAKAGGERFLGGVLPGATARRLQVAAFADEWAASNLDARQSDGPLWVVLGDSISQGVGATTRETGYVGVMQQYLRRRDAWRVINLSKAEAGVLDVLARQLPELVSIAANHEIALVTCIIGAEDMARRTPGLDTALRQVIAALPTGSVVGLLPHGPRAAGALNSVIREECERHAMRIAVLPPRLPGQIGRNSRGLGDVGHAAWARAVLAAADGPVAVAAPATDPRLPVVPPVEDHSPPTDPALPVVPPLDADPAAQTVPGAASAEEAAVAPVAEQAVAEPVVDEPVIEEPAVAPLDEVVAEEAVVEEPAADKPVDEPAVEEPAAADDAAAEPAVAPLDGAVADEPAAPEVEVEPAVEEPAVADEPAAHVEDEPAVEEPATADAVVEEPAVAPLDEVVAEEAVVEEAVVEAPAVEEPVTSLDEVVIENAAVDEPPAAPRDEVVTEEPVVAEPPVDEPPATPQDEVVAEEAIAEEAVTEEPAGDTRVEPPAVETPAGERKYTGTSSWYDSSYRATREEPAGSGVGWAERFGTADRPATGWEPAPVPEPVAEVEPVADDEPLEVEVDLFGDTAADPAEPTAVESPATDDAVATDRITPRGSDVDLFAPTPPADAPRAYGNGDRGPNESGADRQPGYAERADRR